MAYSKPASICLKVLIPFALFAISVFAFSDSAFATSALPATNSSANYAQYTCALSSIDCGALWFSNDSDKSVDKITIPANYTNSTIDIKLYGAVYSTYATSADKYGNNVHILTVERDENSGMTPSSNFDSITYTPITFSGSRTLDRIYRGKGANEANSWSTNWTGGADATLDIADFKSSAASLGNGEYKKDIHVWRCYGYGWYPDDNPPAGVGNGYSSSSDQCYSDKMTIHLVDENEQDATDYVSRSSVKIGDGTEQTSAWRGSTTATAEVDVASVAVRFRHELKRTGNTSFNTQANWELKQDGTLITNGSWSGTSTTGAQVNQNTITVDLAPQETKTICQVITHDRQVKVEISSSGVVTERSRSSLTGSSTACATVTRTTPPPTPGSGSYSGKTEVNLNGATAGEWDDVSQSVEQNVQNGTLALSFTHSLRLNSLEMADQAGGKVYTEWIVDTDNAILNGTSPTAKWYGTSSTGAVVYDPSGNPVVPLGHILSICQDIRFDRTVTYEVDYDGEVSNISGSGLDGESQACATARYPYNFRTTATAHISSSDIVYAGENVQSSFTVSVNARTNQAVSTSAYVTDVPSDTKVSYAQFTMPKNATPPSDDLLSGSTDVLDSTSSLCDYITGKGYSNCVETSTTGSSLNANVTRYVPDVEPGMKYCVISGISHADSHDSPDTDILNESAGINEYALSDSATDPTTSPHWRTSPVSCRTIAKKPSTQVWSGSVYSNGNINATTSKKTPNVALSASPAASATKLFGSWSEYAVVNGASTQTVGFASAAGLGYLNSRAPVSSFCTLTHLSVANDSCAPVDGGYSGASGVNLDDSIVIRLKNRLTTNLHSEEDTRPAGSDLSGVLYHHLSTGADYVYVDGDANIGAVLSTPLGATRIIQVEGTLTIDANVCNGTGDCTTPSSALILSARNNQSLSSLSDVPQTIIFANNINIAPSVTQIDAWLIATGNVNTCNVASLSTTVCNKTLLINGPVVADSVTFNRTAGSWTGGNSATNLYNVDLSSTTLGSIASGEIINFRADSYLWILRQITTSAEPGTAYIRELAPRY